MSRGQSTAARLTPSSPPMYHVEINNVTEETIQENRLCWQNLGDETMTDLNGRKRQRDGAPPRSGQRIATEERRQPAMLSPPLSTPSPPLLPTSSEDSCLQTASRGSETSASSDPESTTDSPASESTVHKSYADYVRGLLTSDVLERPRFDEVRQEIFLRFGLTINPLHLKLEVLHNSRQSLLAEWGDNAQALFNDNSLEAYQKRLMLDDIDNQVRLLRIPR